MASRTRGARSTAALLAALLLGPAATAHAATGAIKEFPVPTSSSHPFGIAAGPDGNLWFTEYQGNRIGRISTSGTITEFPLPARGSDPIGISAGPDGNLWFAENLGNNIGRISTSGTFTEFPVPTADSFPAGIAAGPDGNLWFSEDGSNSIGRLQAAQGGTAYVLSLASGFAPMTGALKAQGNTVQWSFYGPNAATVTDSSGMDLFASGPKSLVSHFSFQFVAAGSYPYVDSLTPTHTGTIKVPIDLVPTSGTTSNTFTVTWSSAVPPAGYVFDVQIKRPGTPTSRGSRA